MFMEWITQSYTGIIAKQIFKIRIFSKLLNPLIETNVVIFKNVCMYEKYMEKCSFLHYMKTYTFFNAPQIESA